EVPREKTLEVKRRIQALGGVGHVALYSREQALQEYQQKDKAEGTDIAGELSENPFPDRLDVRLDDPKKTHAVAVALRDPAQFPEVHKVNAAEEEIGTLVRTQ